MSATTRQHPARDQRLVAFFFEDYALENYSEVETQKCTGCWRPGGRWDDGANVYCEACARYQHGYDQAQESMVRGIIGAAVAGALDAQASKGLVMAAVADALDENVRVEIA